MKTRLTSAKDGESIEILGNHLTGATSVSFNGTPATFAVFSDTLITTTVPGGATSRTVQAITPTGTLSSDPPLQVLPWSYWPASVSFTNCATSALNCCSTLSFT